MDRFVSNHALVEIDRLKEHEETDKEQLEQLKNEIASDSMLKKSIVVDKNTNVILDGHHRLQALKKLGYKKIPVTFVDYRSPMIEVRAWRNGEVITKDTVIKSALDGEKLPPKTSKHMLRLNGNLKHISVIEKEANTPLENLEVDIVIENFSENRNVKFRQLNNNSKGGN